MTIPVDGCTCRSCVHERDQLAAPWLRVEKTLTYRCPDCGSERCPRAYSHERECTGQAKVAGCSCATCVPMGNPFDETRVNIRMILCEMCGNKRCPHAADHRYACTGSNDVGQVGRTPT